MIFCKTNEEVELIRQSSLIVGMTLAEIAKIIQPGITSLELDKVAEDFILSNNAKPGFKGYRDFPNTLCISINEQVVHGIPTNRALQEGDIVSVDCGVLKNGFYSEYAYTFAVGEIDEQKKRLLKITRECLDKGVEMAVAGKRIGDISWAVQEYAEANGYSVVRELVGHGLGKSIHEDPEVPNFGKRGNGIKLVDGMVLAIEPMINMGKKGVFTEEDKWTVTTEDKMPSAHYEHNVVVRKGKAEILSTFEFVEDILNKSEVIVIH